MLREPLLLETSGHTFQRLKNESKTMLSKRTNIARLKSFFEENRADGYYDFSKFDCDNELCRTAAIINYINTPTIDSDFKIFSHNNTDLNLECMLNAFLKHPFNSKSIMFLEEGDINDTYVLKLDDGGCLDYKNERIENFGLEDYIVVSELS